MSHGPIQPQWFQDSEIPAKGEFIQSWYVDSTSSSVGINMLISQDRHYVQDVKIIKQSDYTTLKRAIIDWSFQYKPSAVLMEDFGIGSMLIEGIRHCSPVPISARMPLTYKMDKVLAAASFMEVGKLVIPRNRPWYGGLMTDMLIYPDGGPAPQLFALVQYILWAENRRMQKQLNYRYL